MPFTIVFDSKSKLMFFSAVTHIRAIIRFFFVPTIWPEPANDHTG